MEQVKLENTTTFTLENAGVVYQIMVNYPGEFNENDKYPAYYLLDGETSFPLATSINNIKQQMSKKKFYQPIILVGITAVAPRALKQRFFDFTTLVELDKIPRQMRKMQLEKKRTGGIEPFIHFLETTVKTEMKKHFPIDINNQTIIGHSLGGLCAAYILANYRQMFQHYIIGSPSFWWNDGEILAPFQNFPSGNETVKILVGEQEPNFMKNGAINLFEYLKPKIKNLTYDVYQNRNHGEIIMECVHAIFD
jgi:Predicted hydrolase of the alpha/beta superfamily